MLRTFSTNFFSRPLSIYRVAHCPCLRYHYQQHFYDDFNLTQSLEPISSTLQDSEENITQETSSIDWCFGLSIAGIIFVYSLLLLFAFKTVHRNSEWQNKQTLARSGLKVNPTNAKIHVTLGNFLASKVSHDSHRTHQRF